MSLGSHWSPLPPGCSHLCGSCHCKLVLPVSGPYINGTIWCLVSLARHMSIANLLIFIAKQTSIVWMLCRLLILVLSLSVELLPVWGSQGAGLLGTFVYRFMSSKQVTSITHLCRPSVCECWSNLIGHAFVEATRANVCWFWGCSSSEEHLSNTHETLSSIPSTVQTNAD